MMLKVNLKDAETNSVVRYINRDQGIITNSPVMVDDNGGLSGTTSMSMKVGSNTVTIAPNGNQATNMTLTLPGALGNGGEYLQGDGNGNMTFAPAVSSLNTTAGSSAIVVNSTGTSNISLTIDANSELKALSNLSATGLITRSGSASYKTIGVLSGVDNNIAVGSDANSNITVGLNPAVTVTSLSAASVNIASTTAPSTPVIGQMYYDNTLNALKIYAMNSVTSSAAWATLVLQF